VIFALIRRRAGATTAAKRTLSQAEPALAATK
jgi:hypothetical protein